MTLARLYLDRSWFELRATLRNRSTVMFSMLLPIFLMLIFGTVFKHQLIHGTHVQYSQYIVAGILASGVLYSAFQQLAIAIPEERSNGTLKRMVGSPMPRSAYFVGKLVVCVFIYVFQVLFLLLLGHVMFGIHAPRTGQLWLLFLAVSVLGLLASALLGVAFSNLARDGRAASALAAPLVLFFQFTSGVYFVYTSLPSWMRQVAALFPLKWMAQNMRGVFLPATFGRAEAGHSFQFTEGLLILGAWTVGAAILCALTFRWLAKDQN